MTVSSRPSSCDGALDRGLRLLAVGDVGLDREPADLAGERVEPVLAARGDGHRRPVRGERARRRLADPAAGARDERDRVLEFVAHGPGVRRDANLDGARSRRRGSDSFAAVGRIDLDG